MTDKERNMKSPGPGENYEGWLKCLSQPLSIVPDLCTPVESSTTESTKTKISQHENDRRNIDDEYEIKHNNIGQQADQARLTVEPRREMLGYDESVQDEETLGDQLGSDLMSLHQRIKAVEDQFLRQNTPNEDIQHGMQQLAESFNEIQSLKRIIASLKRQIKQLSLGEEIHTDVDRRYQPH